jgi:hypothetical protein
MVINRSEYGRVTHPSPLFIEQWICCNDLGPAVLFDADSDPICAKQSGCIVLVNPMPFHVVRHQYTDVLHVLVSCAKDVFLADLPACDDPRSMMMRLCTIRYHLPHVFFCWTGCHLHAGSGTSFNSSSHFLLLA